MSLDPLTGLADRHQFLADLEHCLVHGRTAGELTGLVFVKAERLREVNLELSYGEGDAIVIQIAERLRGCLRPCDITARISAAEFAVILPGLSSAAQPVMAVNKIQRTCGEPFVTEGRELKVPLSFGISMSPRDAQTPEQLMRCADVALRHARKSGVEYATFCDCEDHEADGGIELEHELEAALGAGELDAHYQPIVNLSTGQLTRFELLSHWTSPTQGSIDGAVSVGLAERRGLVMPLTLWTLNTGLRERLHWQFELPEISVAFNLPPVALREPDLAELVLRARNIGPTPHGQLTLEVTENSMMSDPKASLAALTQLHEQGVRLSIDNFGTGYSSLAFLKGLPVSELKIDGSFVTSMANCRGDRRIVQAVIDLAHNFDLTVVAEGVVNEETLDTLTLMGCDLAQGPHVARPMPPGAFASWLENSPWEPPGSSGQGDGDEARRSGAA